MAMTARWIAAGVAAVAFVSLAVAQSDLNPKNRQELKREDVPGTNMGGNHFCGRNAARRATDPSHSSW
jgi:hypothetical protein